MLKGYFDTIPIEQTIQLVETYGRVIILGSNRGSIDVNFYCDVHKKGIGIIGVHISCSPADQSYPGFWTFRDNAIPYGTADRHIMMR